MTQLDPADVKARLMQLHIHELRGALCGILKTPEASWPESIRRVSKSDIRKKRTNYQKSDLCPQCVAVLEAREGPIPE